MRKNKLILSGLLLVSLIFTNGCFDGREIDETAYIIALGIDKGELSENYSYTFQFSAPLAVMNGEFNPDENSSVHNLTIDAPDFYTAKNMTNNFLSKNINMSHLKIIIFSENVDDQGFINHSQFLLREREVRPHTAVAVAENSASQYIKHINPTLEKNTAKYYELMQLRSNNVYSSLKTLSDFVDELYSANGISALPMAKLKKDSSPSSTEETSVPAPKPTSLSHEDSGAEIDFSEMWVSTQNSNISSAEWEFYGMAILKNGEICGNMDGDMALFFNILNRDIKSCTISLKNPYNQDKIITFRLGIPSKASFRVNDNSLPCTITLNQAFSIEYLGTYLPEGFATHQSLYSYCDNVLSQKISDFLYHLSRLKQADILNIGQSYKKLFPDQSYWSDELWEKLYKSATFKINIHFV